MINYLVAPEAGRTEALFLVTKIGLCLIKQLINRPAAARAGPASTTHIGVCVGV